MPRTLSGLQTGEFDEIDVLHSVKINSNPGEANQVLVSDGINTDWANVPLPSMPTLTIQKNGASVGTYNPKTDSDKSININVPLEVLISNAPLLVGNVGTQFLITLQKDDATIINNGSNQLEVGAVPFNKLTIADGDIGYSKLTLGTV